MAVSSGGRNTELHLPPRKWTEDREPTPDRLRVSPHNVSNRKQSGDESARTSSAGRKVPVVYFLSKNGHLEHPHFMEVQLSSPEGLYLRDVIRRLSSLRGKGMAALYSWSCKRSYRNGYVWHDLGESDFICPVHGNEYVLKGSELLEPSPPRESFVASSAENQSQKSPSSTSSPPSNDELPVARHPAIISRRRNQSWSSMDLSEYKVCRAEPFSQSSRRTAAQSGDVRRRRRMPPAEEGPGETVVEESNDGRSREEVVQVEVEIEISPPPSDSSPQTLETLMQVDRRPMNGGRNSNPNPTAEEAAGGGGGVRSVLMQLISCGSISFGDCGSAAAKEEKLSLIEKYKGRLPRVRGDHLDGSSREFGCSTGVKLEDKACFSGSLIETKKEEVPSLQRSNSYDGERISQLGLVEKEEMGGGGGEEGESAATKCIPMKQPKAAAVVGKKKEV